MTDGTTPPENSWCLWRLDDNGNRFLVRRFADRTEAEAVAAAYEARGHKQRYFVESSDVENPR